MSDDAKRLAMECEEAVRTITGGLAALRLMEEGNDDRRVQRALDFVIGPMTAAAQELEEKLGLSKHRPPPAPPQAKRASG
jgi:hypothetical protein